MTQPGLFDRPEMRPKAKLLRDPAMAAAISKCLIARLEPASRIVLQSHPQECRWCKYTFARLADALNEFNVWAGWSGLDRPPTNADPDWPTLEPQVEAFMRLPRDRQLALSAVAAGYPEDIFSTYTPYEYGEGKGQVDRSTGEIHDGESVTDEPKGSSAGASQVEPQPVGGRDGAGHRRGRGIGGPETAEGTQDRGVFDRAPQAPGPDQGDSPVPTDPRYSDSGGDQPF